MRTMLVNARWSFLRVALSLASVLPCSMTARLRQAFIGSCMRSMWSGH